MSEPYVFTPSSEKLMTFETVHAGQKVISSTFSMPISRKLVPQSDMTIQELCQILDITVSKHSFEWDAMPDNLKRHFQP